LVHDADEWRQTIVDRRRFAMTLLATGLLSGAAACGRRGPLEPPLNTAQGQEFARRVGGNPQQRNQTQPQGSVRDSVQRQEEQKTTVDVEADIERPRGEAIARPPSDPTFSDEPAPQAGGAPTPSLTGGRRRPPGIIPPKRSFILDPLLE
jgi:predicted small lipoprotein YifL